MASLHQFPTPRAAVAASLRRRIARLERLAPATARVLPFGVASVDAALPEAGLAPGLHEIAPAGCSGAGAMLGFTAALAGLAAQRGPVLWIGAARLYGPGLAVFGLTPERLLLVRAARAKTVPWAMEEGLKSGALGAVVGEAVALDHTAARRLQLAAAASGGLALLVGADGAAPGALGAATTRWRIDAAPSAPEPALQSLPAMGRVRWRVELLHGRHGARPGEWTMEWDHDARRFALVGAMAAALADRTVAARAAAG